MEKEANILKYVLVTKRQLVRIDRSAYAPQMRRIADLQSWLVGPGVLYIPVYRERGSNGNRQLYANLEPVFWHLMSSTDSKKVKSDAESRTTWGR